MKLLKNPLFRIVAIIFILYFALFDKEKENSLGNRMSSEKIKENISYIKDKTIYIKENIENSNKYRLNQQKNAQYQDLLIGIGKNARCGDLISVKITKLQYGSAIDEIKKELKIDKTEFNSKFIGMKAGGKRQFSSQEFIDGEVSDFSYEIELLEILNNHGQKNDENCQ